jgi:hypothetical protein
LTPAQNPTTAPIEKGFAWLRPLGNTVLRFRRSNGSAEELRPRRRRAPTSGNVPYSSYNVKLAFSSYY